MSVEVDSCVSDVAVFQSGVVVGAGEVVVLFEKGLQTSGVVGVDVEFEDLDGDAAAACPQQVVVCCGCCEQVVVPLELGGAQGNIVECGLAMYVLAAAVGSLDVG